jgi:UDP-3-O-[3-hydroxymyristoyl] N-acetylglucosamine deacetylase/3-hydroxyacyl-[acyl-carrier-protein] dehydratase
MQKDTQKTLKKAVTISGPGLHTGEISNVKFLPAPANHGYVFRRVDVEGQPLIRALVENVTETSRGTTLEENGVKVHTIEHALSALFGMGIDNALIEIDGPELPILDGSSIQYVTAFSEAGSEDTGQPRKYFEIKEPVSYSEPDKGIEYIAFPDDEYNVKVLIDYGSEVLGNQFASLDSIEHFCDEIAGSRTFVFLHELEYLLKNNLIKGGSLDNAIVIVDKEVSKETLDQLADYFKRPRLEVVPKQGILNNTELRTRNEPARHKLLDLIGDLSLIGMPIKGKIFATRPGHRTNIEFARKIKDQAKRYKNKPQVPKLDLTVEPLLNINQIRKILPHRFPFLLVDKIMSLDQNSIVGIKNVTFNEAFFVGHFPDEPVMPGVLIVEAMAQVGGILVLNTVPDPENYSTYFMKIEQVRFKKKVVPGDTLIFRLELIQPIRRGIAQMRGQAVVGDTVVMEGELMAQVTRNPE